MNQQKEVTDAKKDMERFFTSSIIFGSIFHQWENIAKSMISKLI